MEQPGELSRRHSSGTYVTLEIAKLEASVGRPSLTTVLADGSDAALFAANGAAPKGEDEDEDDSSDDTHHEPPHRSHTFASTGGMNITIKASVR